MDLRTPLRRASRGVQRGAASVAITMLLLFILAAAVVTLLVMSGSSVRDAATNEEQIAALFAAESGLQRAIGVVNSAITINTMNDTVCTGINDNVTYQLPRGSFKYGVTASTPTTCTGAGCTGCSVRVTGNVGSSSRTLNLNINLGVDNGVSGFGNKVTMSLRNFYNVPATVVFNLAWRRQGCESSDLPNCTDPDQHVTASTSSTNPNCDQCRWYVQSSEGVPSVGGMGTTTSVGANQVTSLPVTQYISTNRSYAEVAGLFPSTSNTSPTVIGAYGYWSDSGTTSTSASGTATGSTNNGVANNTDVCVNPFDAQGNYVQSQSCKSWCYGADTLALGISGRVRFPASGQTFGPVTFNNASMAQIAHFERTDMPTDMYSEIWYAYNANYPGMLSPLSAPAYSGSVVTGSIGATFAAMMTNGSTSMVVTAPSGVLHVGDVVSCFGGGSCPSFLTSATPVTITGQPIGPPGGAGTYTLSAASNCSGGNCTRNLQTSSNLLEVSAFTSGYLSVGDAVSGSGVTAGTTVTSIVGDGSDPGAYGINIAQRVSSTSITTSGSTIHVPNGDAAPTVGTVLAVYSGPGAFAQNTTVSANPTATVFTVSPTPTTMLSGATICGGICALFSAPNSSNSTSSFTVTSTSSTTQWAAGFTCLSGVDKSKIKAVTTTKTLPSTWNEVVQ